MRRVVANSLILLFAGVSILPYLDTNSQTNLPACCRRDGKHHCAMTTAESSGGLALQGISEKCPLYPHAALLARNHGACPQATAIFFVGIVSHPVLHARIDANYRVSNSGSHQKRGPPKA